LGGISLDPSKLRASGLSNAVTEDNISVSYQKRVASFEEVLSKWNEYYQKLRTENQYLDAEIINPENLKWTGSEFVLTLNSSTQEQKWAIVKAKLIHHIVQKLQASIPEIQVVIERTQVESKPYTTQERIKALLDQNPNVMLLIDKLKLEPDHN